QDDISDNRHFGYPIDRSCPASHCKIKNSAVGCNRVERSFQMPARKQTKVAPASPAAQETFDYREADDFYDKSVSEHTRRAYRQVVREFFTALKQRHPAEITPKQVLAWRDSLLAKRRRPHTVTFKLSIVRSFYEYLRAAGVVTS